MLFFFITLLFSNSEFRFKKPVWRNTGWNVQYHENGNFAENWGNTSHYILCIDFIDVFCTAKMISYFISCFSKWLLRKLHGKGDRPILCRAYIHVNFRFLLGNLASTEIFLGFPQSFHKVPGMWKLFFPFIGKDTKS